MRWDSFKDVSEGMHVLNRGFEYVSGTFRNRIAFVDLFEEVYSDVEDDTGKICHFSDGFILDAYSLLYNI